MGQGKEPPVPVHDCIGKEEKMSELASFLLQSAERGRDLLIVPHGSLKNAAQFFPSPYPPFGVSFFLCFWWSTFLNPVNC